MKLLPMKLLPKTLIVICSVLAFFIIIQNVFCGDKSIVQTVTKYKMLVDTLRVKGPTHFIERWTEVTVDPETLQFVEYTEIPTTISFVGATIEKSWVTVEYLLNGDSLCSTVLFVERPSYGKVEITVKPDDIVQATYPAVGFAPALCGGFNLSSYQVELETFYWNNSPLFDAIHFFNLGSYLDYDQMNWGFLVGISGDLDYEHTPFRLNTALRYGITNQKFSGSIGITFPFWSF